MRSRELQSSTYPLSGPPQRLHDSPAIVRHRLLRESSFVVGRFIRRGLQPSNQLDNLGSTQPAFDALS